MLSSASRTSASAVRVIRNRSGTGAPLPISAIIAAESGHDWISTSLASVPALYSSTISW